MRAAAPEETSPKAGEYVVYLGLDVSANLRGTRCPVISGNSAELQVRSESETVRIATPGARLLTAMEPKLSRTQAMIDGLKGDRIFSAATDPQRDAIAQQMLMESVQAHNQDLLQMHARVAEDRMAGTQRAPAISQEDVSAAREGVNVAAENLNTALATPTYRSALPGNFQENESYDTFEVTFRLSTPAAHDRVSGILRLMVRDPANPQQAVQALKFFELGELGPKRRRVRLQQTGLPPGFSVDSYSVHIYADGRELPTNLSRNRVELTADEAHQFLILRHLQSNRQGSLPAQMVPELRPAGWRELIGPGQMSTSIELAINHEGRVTNILPAGGIPTALSPELETAVRALRFLPALVNGRAVDSQGTFALGEFVP